MTVPKFGRLKKSQPDITILYHTRTRALQKACACVRFVNMSIIQKYRITQKFCNYWMVDYSTHTRTSYVYQSTKYFTSHTSSCNTYRISSQTEHFLCRMLAERLTIWVYITLSHILISWQQNSAMHAREPTLHTFL